MIGEKINVSGIAIRPGVSKNGILYKKEELEKFMPTLKNKPMLKDHRSETDNTIGLVTNSSSNGKGIVSYEGWIKEDGSGIIERITDGRIKEVSIGAFVERIVKENDDDDFVIAEGIHAMELSTTPTPGVKGTSLKQSLEAIQKKKAGEKVTVMPIMEDFNTFQEIEEKKVEEEINNPTIEVENKIENNKEEIKMAEETVDKAKLEEELRNKISKEKADLEAKEKAMRESLEIEIKEKLELEAKEKAEADKAAAKAQEELKAKLKEEAKKELTEEIAKAKEILSEMKGKTEEEIKKTLTEKGISEDFIKGLTFEKVKKPMHGKVNTESKQTQEAVAESFVVENSEFGSGYAYFKQPNADGTYGGQ